ncbi:MAG: hypothetical protein GXN93_00730 [Candidatus Diapherotrites archaeon]|nr:hypothetical protein [Candidatus Diapherotrites archaeon]
MEWKHIHGIVLFILVFFLVDLLLDVLALFGFTGFFMTVSKEAGRIVVHGSDVLVFLLSVPIALALHILWYRGRWSWFSQRSEIHRNVFYVFLVLYLVLFFALLYAGAGACHASCSSGPVSSCTVDYGPFGVNVVYSCRTPTLNP